jgi:hypothetical protein
LLNFPFPGFTLTGESFPQQFGHMQHAQIHVTWEVMA